MKRKRFTEEPITYALRQAESGVPVTEICRKRMAVPRARVVLFPELAPEAPLSINPLSG